MTALESSALASLVWAGCLALPTPAATQGADNRPTDPYRSADDLYYVGASDIAVYLIKTPAGHILIDAGYAETVPIIRANIAKLGLKLEDIKIILHPQAHYDHSPRLPDLKALPHAQLLLPHRTAPLL